MTLLLVTTLVSLTLGLASMVGDSRARDNDPVQAPRGQDTQAPGDGGDHGGSFLGFAESGYRLYWARRR